MMTFTDIHITRIRADDTVEHAGAVRTVSGTDIKSDPFMGITIFGDSYKLGYQPVRKVSFECKKDE